MEQAEQKIAQLEKSYKEKATPFLSCPFFFFPRQADN
jgi:hypothetical protein